MANEITLERVINYFKGDLEACLPQNMPSYIFEAIQEGVEAFQSGEESKEHYGSAVLFCIVQLCSKGKQSLTIPVDELQEKFNTYACCVELESIRRKGLIKTDSLPTIDNIFDGNRSIRVQMTKEGVDFGLSLDFLDKETKTKLMQLREESL
ncbi:MAG: hypothetical protein HQK52_19375 [Oligoflexia bacterium]|nr:hypothetical protein [Oligoflexia bacterium]